MKTQFLHEEHNRQDKARKPGYRPDLLAGGPSEPAPTALAKLIARAQARQRLVEAIRNHRFAYLGFNFKFGWNLEIFARKNNLAADDEKTKAAMETVRQAAQRDVEAYAERIKTAPIRDQGNFYHFDYEPPQTQCQMFRK